MIFGFGELPDGYVVGTPSTLTIKIADDDNDTPQGDVTIDSEAKVGETLTAITSEITDRENPDNPDTTEIDPTPPLDFTYQWQRTNGTTDPAEYEDIEGAISSTYPLTEKDVGERLTVKVTSTDQFRNGDDTPHKLELPTATVPVVYNQPRPFIIVGDLVGGRLTTGVQLTADTSGMVDEGVPLSNNYTYEWKRDDVVIVGAVDMTYTLVDEDVAEPHHRDGEIHRFRGRGAVSYERRGRSSCQSERGDWQPANRWVGAGWFDVGCGSGRVLRMWMAEGCRAKLRIRIRGSTAMTMITATRLVLVRLTYCGAPMSITQSRLWPALWMLWVTPTLDPAIQHPRLQEAR